jgi:hypothetical protein
MNILPKEGNMIDMRLTHNINRKLDFSSKEIGDYSINQEGNSIYWKGDIEKDLIFEEREIELINKALKKLDSEGKVTPQLLPLFDLFN